MIKAIIFDCFGVLTEDAWRAFCASLPPGEGLQKAKELNHRYDAGLINLKDFVLGVEQATGHESKQVEDIIMHKEFSKNIVLIDYIKGLKGRYKIGLISNIATNWVRDDFLTPEEQSYFDDMVFSFEVGTTKPDPRIYEVAADRLGVEPSKCVFIDDIERYTQAAQAVGMSAIVYSDFNQMKTDLEALLA